jgi:hypothetical protein
MASSTELGASSSVSGRLSERANACEGSCTRTSRGWSAGSKEVFGVSGRHPSSPMKSTPLAKPRA